MWDSSLDYTLGARREMEILRSSFGMRIRPVLHHSLMAQLSLYLYRHQLLTYFDEFSEAQSEVPTISYLVLDGAAIVQMLKPAATNNFEEYALSHNL